MFEVCKENINQCIHKTVEQGVQKPILPQIASTPNIVGHWTQCRYPTTLGHFFQSELNTSDANSMGISICSILALSGLNTSIEVECKDNWD